MYSLVVAARKCGMDADAFEVSQDQLGEIGLPAIVHLKRGHYVVLESIAGEKITFADPAHGRQTTTINEFAAIASGIVILIEPVTAVQPLTTDNDGSALQLPPLATVRESVALAMWTLVSGAGFSFAIVNVAHLITTDDGRGATSLRMIYAIVGSIATLIAETLLSRIDNRAISRAGDAVSKAFVRAMENASPEFITSRAPRYLEYSVSEADPLYHPQSPRPARIARALTSIVLIGVVAFQSPVIAIPTVAMVVALLCVALSNLFAGDPLERRRHLFGSRELLRAIFEHPADLLAGNSFSAALRQWLRARSGSARHDGKSNRWRSAPPLLPLAVALSIGVISAQIIPRDGSTSLTTRLAAVVLVIFAITFSYGAAGEWSRYRLWRQRLSRVREIQREEIFRGNSPPLPPGSESGSSLATANVLLECRRIWFRYPEELGPSLEEINLSVHAGEAIAIVGDSGSGKTLLATLLLGLRHPTRGRVLLHGQDVSFMTETDRNPLIAGVLDDHRLMDGTIHSFLRGNSQVSDAAIDKAVAITGLGNCIERLPMGMLTPLSNGGMTLTSHERRLLSIARVLTASRPLLVFDAVLDTLDTDRAKKIATSLAGSGASLVLMTSRPEIVPHAFRRLRLANRSLNGGEVLPLSLVAR